MKNKFLSICTKIMMAVMVIVLAAGTVVEKFHDNDFARQHIYGAWWFYLLLTIIGLMIVWHIVADKMWRQPYRLLLYSSVPLIMLGGLLTATTGQHGSMMLHPGVASNSFTIGDDTVCGVTQSIPFSMTLQNFEVVPYPGTHSPMDFVSHITVEANGTAESADISMNNIYRRDGYRFYQEDYGDDGSSTLSVAHDPWGIAVTYIGYILMALGIIGLFASPRSHFRRLFVLLAFLAGMTTVQAKPQSIPKATADKMGQMYVLYKGRVCPLQTLAKDFTTKLSGNARYQGYTPEQVLAGWMFYFSQWADEPMIKIKGDDVKQLLGTTAKRASYRQMMEHADDLQGGRPMGQMGGAMPTGMGSGNMKSKTMRAASEKYNLVQMLIGGKYVKMYPVHGDDGTLGWYAQDDDLTMDLPSDEYFFIRKQLGYCQELVLKGDWEELERVFDKTIEYQTQKATDVLPSGARLRAERLYNKLTTGKWLAMLAVTLGLIFFALAIFRQSRSTADNLKTQSSTLNIQHFLPFAATLLITLFLLLIMILRWIAGGHAPMAGGFDSMNLMSIVVGIIGLAFARRYPMAPSIALLSMGFCQLVAMMSGSNPPVTHLMPVLSSPLLTLHVTVIMISYALFFFVMLNGVAALILRRRADEMMRVSLLMLYPAAALLAIGVVIGALWANISWGNYWSWDPKEVWALITLLIYLYPLMRNAAGASKQAAANASDITASYARPATMSATAFHIYCVLAFFSVIITYFGVNLILGGIHAYN